MASAIESGGMIARTQKERLRTGLVDSKDGAFRFVVLYFTHFAAKAPRYSVATGHPLGGRSGDGTWAGGG